MNEFIIKSYIPYLNKIGFEDIEYVFLHNIDDPKNNGCVLKFHYQNHYLYCLVNPLRLSSFSYEDIFSESIDKILEVFDGEFLDANTVNSFIETQCYNKSCFKRKELLMATYESDDYFEDLFIKYLHVEDFLSDFEGIDVCSLYDSWY